MEENIEYEVIELLNKFENMMTQLKSVNLEEPLDFLKELVKILKHSDEFKLIFEDHQKLNDFINKIMLINQFVEDNKHTEILNYKKYIANISLPESEELSILGDMKKKVDNLFNFLDLDDIMLNESNFNEIKSYFFNFREKFISFYITFHEEVNLMNSNFCEGLLSSNEMKLLKKLNSIPQIKNSLTYSAQNIQDKIVSIQKNKCNNNKDSIKKDLDKKSVCQSCKMDLNYLISSKKSLDLVKKENEIKKKLFKSLLACLNLINSKKLKIFEILNQEIYQNKPRLNDFFTSIFQIYNKKDFNVNENSDYIEELVNRLYDDLYTDDVINVIQSAFKEEHRITIDVMKIVNLIDAGVYTEEDLMKVFKEKKKIVKQVEQEEYNLSQKEAPIIIFRFRKN
jgi:hypothetical protein